MSAIERDNGDAEQPGAAPGGGRSCAQEARSARTRQAIYEAAVKCLDEHGFAETSVMKVQSLAGVSRGALTHQYPTKESLIVAVAEQLLEEIRHIPSTTAGPRPEGGDGYVEWLLHFTLGRFVDTPEGRALTEIMQASRTDRSLADKLASPLAEWDERIEAWYVRRLAAEGGDDEVRDFVRLFFYLGRGMLASGLEADAEDRNAAVRSLALLAANRIRRRSETGRAPEAAPSGRDGCDAPEKTRAAAE